MAFGASFGSPAFNGGNTSSAGSLQTGPELQEVQSIELEFSGFCGETKLQLLPKPWPEDALPPPTSSLLSINSKSGILAAAGPDSVIVAKIDSVREAFKKKDGDSNIKPFQPQLILPIGIRVSQVAFSADGSCLAISAEQGGGIAAYEVQNLLQGNTNSAFELASDGQPLRALVPNPAPESAELFAAVTAKGQLMVADMKTRSWRPGQKGTVYQESASAVAWSNRGKALLVGLGDGTMVQLKADGASMAQIPRPPGLQGDKHVSAISWLENDLAIIVYTPSSSDGMADPSEFYIWERTPKSNPPVHKFSKLPEVAAGWGDRTPANQFMSRLRDYHNCDHIVIVSATPSEDIGIISRSKVPLGEGAPANLFASVTQSNDARRAQLPMKADMSASTTPIGMDLDLASTTVVERPIPGGEIENSPGPLPGVMVLNNDGILAAWWLIYADAIRQGVNYTGLEAAAAPQNAPKQAQSQSIPTQTAKPFGSAGIASANSPAFGQTPLGGNTPAFGQTSTFGTASPAGASFGQPSKPTFGAPAFGTASLGLNKPTFGSPNAVGAARPAFGSPSAMGATAPTFGSVSTPGTTQAVQQPATAFGQTGQLGAFGGAPKLGTASPAASSSLFGATSKSGVFGGSSSAASPFAQMANTSSGQGGASAKSQTGFSAFGSTASPFGGSSVPVNPFAPGGSTPSPFGSNTGLIKSPFASGGSLTNEAKSPFGQMASAQSKSGESSFGNGSPFKLTSTFAETATKPSELGETTNEKGSGGSLFGSAFGNALENAKQTAPVQDHEEDMEDEPQPSKEPVSPEIVQSTTPKETPALQKTAAPSFPTNSIWGASIGGENTDKNRDSKDKPTPASGFSISQSVPRASSTQDTPKASEKAPADRPLPPDATSKDTFTPTNSSTSSIDTSRGSAEAAPLPPDFTKLKPSTAASGSTPSLPLDVSKAKDTVVVPADSANTTVKKPSPTPETAPLPPDFLKPNTKTNDILPPPPLPAEETSQFDDEGSGVDVANELSNEPSPESSFGSKSSVSNIFVSKAGAKPHSSQSVFDKVAKPYVPFFEMPPPSKEPESPRSPSPVRSGRGMPDLRPPPLGNRSVSGPATTKPAQGPRKATMGRMQPPEQKFVKPVARLTADHTSVENERQVAEKKRREQRVAEEQDLSDQEDEYIRAELEAPVQPTTKIPAFFTHTDYTGGVSKRGVPGQIEVVYRDANSMLDTLGLNARGLASWIAGHSLSKKTSSGGSKRQIEDLEEPDDWTLVEVSELVGIESRVRGELEAGTIGDKQSQTLARLVSEMTSEIAKLKRRNDDVARNIETLAQLNEATHDGADASDSVPLGVVAAEAQHDLRRALTNFHSNLAAAEEGVALLRAKLASVGHEDHDPSGSRKIPTVEAVERTIGKMIAMFERKCADLDVLTSQARQLGILEEKRPGSKAGAVMTGTPGRRSRSGSPFESPSASLSGSRYGTPFKGSPMRNSYNAASFTPSKSKLRSSVVLTENMGKLHLGVENGADAIEEVTKKYVERLRTRQEVKAILKETLGEGRPRIRSLDDD